MVAVGGNARRRRCAVLAGYCVRTGLVRSNRRPRGVQVEAEVQLAYLYRDGRLPKDDVQAYMWFAIVGSSVVPPTDDDMKRVARHMTKAQIVQAQRMAEDWIKRHTAQPANVAQAKR